MAVFEGCSILLWLTNIPFKEKLKIKSSIKENGGHISYGMNKQCSFVVTNDVSKLSSRLHRIQKYQTPVVLLDYVHSCLEKNVLLPVDEFKLDISSPYALSPAVPAKPAPLQPPVVRVPVTENTPQEPKNQRQKTAVQEEKGMILDKFRVYKDTDRDLPGYSEYFHVAKYSVFHKVKRGTWCLLELQSYSGDDGQKYRVVQYKMENKQSKRDMLVYPTTSEEAVDIYKVMMENLKADGLKQEKEVPPQVMDFGSFALQQLLLEEKLSTGVLSHNVGVFVELLWTEAQGCLDNTLRVPIDKLSINDVSRAEGLLIQAQIEMKKANHAEVACLMDSVFTLIPHKLPPPPADPGLVSQKLDLCQLIRDVLNLSEVTMNSSVQSSLGKYRALRCSIEEVPKDSSEYKGVTTYLKNSCDSNLEYSQVNVQHILRVTRGVELQTFRSELGNIKSLFHSSSPRNFVGILSRGLLLPRVGVEDHGITRTDGGNLGGGIYFSDSMSTSIGYSKASETDGSRLMLVCDVALGACKDVYKKDLTLTQAPEGHMSVHAVRKTPKAPSEFEHDEFVVYSPDQVRLKYVVQFICSNEPTKKFTPCVDMNDEQALPPPGDVLISEKDVDIDKIKNPLMDIKAGLLNSSGEQLPLQAVHVKCRLKDLFSQVIIFQKYTNLGTKPIEAKYVFPLDDSAAVCGFEAFINGKHVVGQVKEKEQARREYKQAVEKGHGAYLMDQDAPDVFTISVGNLPPGATVIIKVTFVSELVIKDGSVFFSLPGSVAPWQESAALNQTTQMTFEKVCVTDGTAGEREFTLDMAIEMPYEITHLQCISHSVRMKKTDCKAVVSIEPGSVMRPEGFQLFISLSEVHLPRMWVENHPDKDSQACMLVFYPKFDSSQDATGDEVILLLDVSQSMRGESLQNARMLALHIIKTLNPCIRVNIVVFGTDHSQAFLAARPLGEAWKEAERFIKASPQSGGSTELWRPLRLLNLLPPSRGTRNLLLLSDGHIQNGMVTLQMLRDNARHSRLFTCGLSTTANRHMLRALAQTGGGAYEYFDTAMKHTWAQKVSSQVQRMSAPSCSSVSVKWQQFNPAAPSPVQAPKRLQSLFNDCHTIVFGFVPHCTQATLLGNLSGQELNTMVSTSELQKTKGTFLHKLTARAIIRDYEDGSLDFGEPIQEGRKSEMKSYIIALSKEFSILSQFTSFVAIEERDSEESEKGFTDLTKLLAEEDVDILPYMMWADSGSVAAGSIGSSMELLDEGSDMQLALEVDSEPDSRSYSPTEARVESSVMQVDSEPDTRSYSPTEVQIKSSVMQSKMFEAKKTKHMKASRRCDESVEVGASMLEEEFPVLHAPIVLGPLPSWPPVAEVAEPSSKSDIGGASKGFSFGASSHSFIERRRRGTIMSTAEVAEPISKSDFGGASKGFSFGASSHSRIGKRGRAQGVIMSTAEMARDESWKSDIGEGFGGVLFGSTSVADEGYGQCADAPQLFPHRFRDNEILPRRRKLSPLELELASAPPPPLGRPPPPPPPPPPCAPPSNALYYNLPSPAPPPPPPPRPSSAFSSPSFLPSHDLSSPGFSFFPIKDHGTKSLSPPRRQRDRGAEFRIRRLLAEAPRSSPPVDWKHKWRNIFKLQLPEGFWELTDELGRLINVDLCFFADVYLKSKGINSLGEKARIDILRLLATVLALQLMRVKDVEMGRFLQSLFSLSPATEHRPEHWESLKRAVDWVTWADRQYPCICSRLEFGVSWESTTRQLLGLEPLPPFSPLQGLSLQKSWL